MEKQENYLATYLNVEGAVNSIYDALKKKSVDILDKAVSDVVVSAYTIGRAEGCMAELKNFCEYLEFVANTLTEEDKIKLSKAIDIIKDTRVKDINKLTKGLPLNIYKTPLTKD